MIFFHTTNKAASVALFFTHGDKHLLYHSLFFYNAQLPTFIQQMKCFAPHSRLSMASTRLLSKVGTLRQTYVRKHTFCKRQESFLNAHTPHFHLSTIYRQINRMPKLLQLRPTPIAKPHILFGRKALQTTLPKTGTHRLPFVYNVKHRSSVFMSPTNGNHCVKKPVFSCVVSLPTHSLFYF